MNKKIKVLFHSNYSRMVTGFGKNMKNVLLALHNDPDIEVYEAANGVPFGRDVKTPWPCYGTMTENPEVLASIANDPFKNRAASYGYYEIDKIIDIVKPDVYVGIEDIWAFSGFVAKPWWNTTHKIIWTTLDSLPLMEESMIMAKSCDKFLVWADFATQEMKKFGIHNISTIHGAIDLNHFKPLENRREIRQRHGLDKNFVIGFVFKNQLRKSVPNLLDGFKLFKQIVPEAKLILHTDWGDNQAGWDIVRYLKEKKISPHDVLATYRCSSCGRYSIKNFEGAEINCPFCNSAKTFKTKTAIAGLTEEQLNEVYNCMDVYCHPFTSGGQELPIQEAKAAGLITLVTEYSCGTDSCYEHQGGLPLKWHEYREPQSQFIKASTDANSICNTLLYVYGLDQERKQELVDNGKKWIEAEFSVEKIVENLKGKILETVKQPIISFKNAKPSEELKVIPFDSFLDKERKDRILFVMPESEEDVFLSTALLPSIKKAYPDKDIYFATKPQFKEILLGNRFIYKVLDFHPHMENLFMMEGQGSHKGYFEICFLPHIGTQKHLDYLHHGNDIITLNIKE